MAIRDNLFCNVIINWNRFPARKLIVLDIKHDISIDIEDVECVWASRQSEVVLL